MSTVTAAELTQVRREADCLYTPEEVYRAVARMAAAMTQRVGGLNPLLLVTMTGGMVPTSLLLPHLEFPLQVDYIHLTRYGTATAGGELTWIKPPPAMIVDRLVVIVDDLLDHGLTLKAAKEECLRAGARAVLTAVLVVKDIPNRPGLAQTDFFGLTTPDRYLFGFGMDYKTYWRNGGGIFAVRGQ